MNWAEYTNWVEVRANNMHIYRDNLTNDGFVYGLNLIDSDEDWDPYEDDAYMDYEIADVQWFKTSKEREAFILECDLKMLDF